MSTSSSRSDSFVKSATLAAAINFLRVLVKADCIFPENKEFLVLLLMEEVESEDMLVAIDLRWTNDAVSGVMFEEFVELISVVVVKVEDVII